MKKTTVHDRIDSLSKLGLVEKKDEVPAKKNKQPVPLWGLAPFGLWVTAHEPILLGIEKCRRTIMDHWTKFTEIYGLDKVRTEEPAYQPFTNWLESNEGLLEFLDTFGSWPLAGEIAAFGTFRQMIDLGLLRRHGALLPILPAVGEIECNLGEWVMSAGPKNPYLALGEIASKHETFGKLDSVLRKVNAPIFKYYDKVAYEELVEKLSVPLGKAIATKLAVTPFYTDRKMPDIGISLENLAFLSPDSLFDSGTRITIKADKVSVETFDPDEINAEWKEYCELHVIKDAGKSIRTISPRKVVE